jgi:hypothetical protein
MIRILALLLIGLAFTILQLNAFPMDSNSPKEPAAEAASENVVGGGRRLSNNRHLHRPEVRKSRISNPREEDMPKYGPWIVQMEKSKNHESMIAQFEGVHSQRIQGEGLHEGVPGARPTALKIGAQFKLALYGMVVTGLTKEEILAIDGVTSVEADRQVSINSGGGDISVGGPDMMGPV